MTTRYVKRSFLNIEELKHLVIAIECEDFNEIREVEKEIKPFLKKIPTVSFVIFLNIDKVEDLSYVPSTSSIILFKEDMVRKITPKLEVINRIDALDPDVFINLNRKPSAVIDFLSAISQAKMRVGFEEKKELTELMLAVPNESGFKLFFEKLIHFMGQINTKAA